MTDIKNNYKWYSLGVYGINTGEYTEVVDSLVKVEGANEFIIYSKNSMNGFKIKEMKLLAALRP